MQKLASVGILVLTFGLVGCPDATSTAPVGVTGLRTTPMRRPAGAVDLTLHPSGFGRHSYAAWKAEEGRPDSEGDADEALYFQKMTATTTFAAAVAIIKGVEGFPASAITGLAWERRFDGHCGAGAPRWNLGLQGPSGQRFTVFLGCAAAIHTPTGSDDQGRQWIRDSYPGTGADARLVEQILAQTGLETLSGLRVRSLAIVYDEGIEFPPGFVHLDNITVTVNGEAHVFTGAMDNGRTP